MATNNAVNSPLAGTTGLGQFVGDSSPVIKGYNFAVDSGAANAYVANFTPSVGSLVQDFRLDVLITNANSGTSTLKINGNAPINIINPDGSNIAANALLPGMLATFAYASGSFQLMNSALNGLGVTAAQVQSNAFNQGVDSGIANAYDVAVSPAITTPYNGMLLTYEPQAGNNSSNVTIALNGGAAFGVFSYNGSLPLPSDIEGFTPTFFIFSTANNAWFLINPQQFVKIPQHVTQGEYLYYPDQGVAPNVYIATPGIASAFQPPGSPTVGQPFVFIPANSNSGASTLDYNANGALAIQYKGSALVGGEMVVNLISLIFYDGTQYQLINSQVSSGGSSPWTAGAGTDSAIGGDGTETCTGNYSLTYGSSSCTNSAPNSFSFGDATTITSSGAYNFAYGHACVIDNAVTGAFAYGFQATCHGNYDFAFGSNNTRTGASGQSKFAFGNNCSANVNYSFAFGNASNVSGAYAFAFGNGAGSFNNGSVCWGDSHAAPNVPTANNQYNLTFSSGYYFYFDNSPTLAASFLPTGSTIIGTNTNNNAPAGYVGEFFSSVVLAGSSVSITSAVNADVTTLNLPAGDFDTWGNVGFVFSVAAQSVAGWSSSTSATTPDPALYSSIVTGLGTTIDTNTNIAIPYKRFSFASPTTIYLSTAAVFGAGTGSAYGAIYARRAR